MNVDGWSHLFHSLCYISVHVQNIRIVKYNVGTPDSVGWDSDDRNAHILLRVPSEFHVSPFLRGGGGGLSIHLLEVANQRYKKVCLMLMLHANMLLVSPSALNLLLWIITDLKVAVWGRFITHDRRRAMNTVGRSSRGQEGGNRGPRRDRRLNVTRQHQYRPLRR